MTHAHVRATLVTLATLALLLCLLARLAHADTVCTTPPHLCTDQYASCCPGSFCNDNNRCQPLTDTTTTSTPTPTTTSPLPSTTSTTLPPVALVCRPTGADLAVLVHSRPDYYRNFHGRTADQQERDCLENTATALSIQVYDRARDLLDDDTRHRFLGTLGLTTIFTRIQVIPPYRGCLLNPGGCVWVVNPQGRNYQEDWTNVVAMRTDLLAQPDRAAAAFADAPNLRDFLNVNSDFTGSAGFPSLDASDVPYDSDREDAFPLDTHHLGVADGLPCFTGDCSGLDAVALAHACDTAHKCGEPTTPACAALADAGTTVASAHLAYEAACGLDEDCQWRRRLPAFNGFIDPNWFGPDRCLWPRVTDVFHESWVDAQRVGDTRTALFEGTRHLVAHVCMNVGATALLQVVMPADGLPSSQFAGSYGGRQSCVDLLPQLVATYGLMP